MSWRLAKSLEVLRSQVDEAYPNRNKASDGTIGDAAHAASASDHNPNTAGVVCALDLTHNPPYFDGHSLADRLLLVRHPDLKYLISNSRIAGAWSQWRWTGYAGADPHYNHIHISVGVGPDGQSSQPYDDEIKWNIGGEEMLSKPEVIQIYKLAFDDEDKDVPQNVIDAFTGKPVAELVNYLIQDASYQAHKARIITPVKATKLAPGLYQV